MSSVYDDVTTAALAFNRALARANMIGCDPEIVITFQRDRDLFEFHAHLQRGFPAYMMAMDPGDLQMWRREGIIRLAGLAIRLRSAERSFPPGDLS